MKKAVCAAIVLILIILTVTPCYAADGLNLLILGDSISTGYGLPYAGTVNCDSYGNLLSQKLGVASDNFYNGAVNGYTSSNLLELLPQIEDRIKNADVIVFSIGGNDVLSSMIYDFILSVGASTSDGLSGVSRLLNSADTDVESVLAAATDYFSSETRLRSYDKRVDTYKDNYTQIAGLMREYNPDALIIAQTLYNPMDDIEAFSFTFDFSNYVLGKMNDATNEISAEYNILVADIFTAFAAHGSELTNILSSDIHPNADGHAIIYETVYALVEASGSLGGDSVPADAETSEQPAADTDTETVETTEAVETTESAAQTTEAAENGSSSGAVTAAIIIAAAVVLVVVFIVVLASGGKKKDGAKKK